MDPGSEAVEIIFPREKARSNTIDEETTEDPGKPSGIGTGLRNVIAGTVGGKIFAHNTCFSLD